MDGWMGRWKHGCMDVWMDGWWVGWVEPRKNYTFLLLEDSRKILLSIKFPFPLQKKKKERERLNPGP